MTTGKRAERNTRKYEKRDPQRAQKKKARHQVEHMVDAGKLKKPKKCPNCGATGTRIEWHHTSLSTDGGPKGEWRCSKCNRRGPGAK